MCQGRFTDAISLRGAAGQKFVSGRALKGLSVKECQYWWCTKLLGAPPSSPVASMSMAAAPGCRWLRQSLTVTCA